MNSKFKLKKHVPLFSAVLVCITWIILAILVFLTNLVDIETSESDSSLISITESNAAEVRYTFERYISALEIASTVIEEYDDFKSPEVISLLSKMAETDGYERLSIDYADGTSQTSDGHAFDISKLGYLDKIKNGETFILDVTNSLTDGAEVIKVFVPLRDKSGKPVASLRGAIKTKVLSETFGKTFFYAGGYFHLVDGNGKYVAASSSADALLMGENYFNTLDSLEYEKGFSADQIREGFSNQQKGFSKYSYKGQYRNSYFAPVGINDWLVIMVIPRQVIDQESMIHVRNAFLLMSQIILVLLLMMLIVYVTQRSARNKALLNEKCFKALAEQTNKVIFEWDFSINKIISMTNFRSLFGREAITKNSADDALNAKAVHEDDRVVFTSIFNEILKGNSITDVRFRIADSKGVYHWCVLSGVVINDTSGKPFKAIGSLENIDQQVKKEEDLRQKAERDQLTGLYNKTTTELLIKSTLIDRRNSAGNHALMIIDVDNFKNVNDMLGHLYGDIVLTRLSDMLKQLFRSDDIVGRVGGDEFFVFLKNYTSIDVPKSKAAEICKLFRNTYTENNVSVSISASIGIANFPEHGSDFDTLYRSADTALYNTKAKGKDNFTFYDGNTVHIYRSTRTEIDTIGGIPQKSFRENRIEFVFKLLYSSENPISAVKSVLQLITEHFDFSRGYIFETSENGSYTTNTFEWCAKGITPEIDNLQYVPIDAVATSTASFYKTGMFILRSLDELPPIEREVLEPQGIKSMFQFGIIDKGKLLGFIGFDDCVEGHVLTDVEIDEISTICNVLSVFIIKQRTLERSNKNYMSLSAIINNMDGYAYVIDKDSYEVLFENHNIKQLTNTANVGKCCYKTYMGRETPCDICPVTGLTGDVTKYSVEIDNKEYGICSKTTGSMIDWINGKKACLIGSIDISEYRRTGN